MNDSDVERLTESCCVSVTLFSHVPDVVTDTFAVDVTDSDPVLWIVNVRSVSVKVCVTVDVSVCVSPDAVISFVRVFFGIVNVTSDNVTDADCVIVMDTVSNEALP